MKSRFATLVWPGITASLLLQISLMAGANTGEKDIMNSDSSGTARTHVAGIPDEIDGQTPVAEGYEELVKALTRVIQFEVEAKDLPALSISLIDGDEIVWAAGFGFRDAARKQPATAHTVYRVGSISKLFTDLAVTQLVDRGELKLDAPVTEVLPDFTPQNPFEIPITLRQLMSHRSGLVRESPVGNYFDPDEPSLKATIASLNKTQLVYRPETRTKYSNAGIAVVGAALEKQSGKKFSQQMREAVIHPLNLKNSDFERTPAIEEKLATAWMWTYDGRRFEAPKFGLGTAPAGNLYSTVVDLGKFLIAVFRGGALEEGQLLKPETLQLMMSPQSTTNGEPAQYGIGFHLDKFQGERRIGHGGAVYGFSTQLSALPDRKLGVVAVSSLDGSNGIVSRLTDYALSLLLARRDQKTLPLYPVTGPLPAELAHELLGRYQHGNSTIEVTRDKNRVFLRQGVFRFELRAHADGVVIDDPIANGPSFQRINSDSIMLGKDRYDRIDDDLPADIPPRWKGIIGEYGWDHNVLYILEDRGQLYALIEWFYYYPLTEINESEFAFPNYGLYHGEKLKFIRAADGTARSVVAADVTFQRRETGTRDGETFKIKPIKPIDQLREGALLAKPPSESGVYRDTELREVIQIEPSIKLDIRYATTNNFTGSVFYKQPRAFLQKPAVEAVQRAHKRLQNYGLGLLIHDAYRPWYVTKMFYEATPADLKHFVANPANGSRHNRGCAVDLTLFDLATGAPIPMVAGYDEFSPRSFPAYPGGTSRQRWHRALLRQVMEAEGFSVYEFEWWHFDFQDWRKYRIQNLEFDQID